MTTERVVRRHSVRSTGRTWRRFAVALGVLGTVGGLLWWFTGPAVEVASGSPPPESLTTPLLSARRIPVWLGAATGARSLRNELQGPLSELPESSCVLFESEGAVLVSQRSGDTVIPASNLKPLTAEAAVALLGAETRLATTVASSSGVGSAGQVSGDLFLIGGGDPVLSTAGYEPYPGLPRNLLTPLELLADEVVAAGVSRVTGSVVGDASRFDDRRDAPGWEPSYITDGQVAPLSALIVDDGRNSFGGVALDSPALGAAEVFTRLLEARGVEIDGGPLTGAAPAATAEIARVESPTVAELAQELVTFSDNTTAELLVKEIGRVRKEQGSTAAGIEEIQRWAAERGITGEGTVIADGSGLSRENRLSCDSMVALLTDVGIESPLTSWLARPGEPGTLEDRMVGSELTGRVRAKTGSLNGVRTLAGWLLTLPERNVAFAVGANGDDAPEELLESLEEQILASALSYPAVPPVEKLGPKPARTS